MVHKKAPGSAKHTEGFPRSRLTLVRAGPLTRGPVVCHQ